jgi:hypothetical protein
MLRVGVRFENVILYFVAKRFACRLVSGKIAPVAPARHAIQIISFVSKKLKSPYSKAIDDAPAELKTLHSTDERAVSKSVANIAVAETSHRRIQDFFFSTGRNSSVHGRKDLNARPLSPICSLLEL